MTAGRALRGLGIGVAAFALLIGAILVVRPEVWHDVRFRFADHLGVPPTTVALGPISVAEPPQLRLAAAGDVGTGGDAEWRTAATADALETEREYDGLLLLGDNVYPDGDPDDLAKAVFDPFAGVLDGDTALLPVLGNHDVRDGNADAHAAAIGMPGRWYARTLGGVMVVALDSNQSDNPDQLAWLEHTLRDTDATWIVATMHHPPYSGGYHGSSKGVRRDFSPLFEKYGVQLVLAGHDHDYQRSRPIAGVTYIVSGGAAKLRPARLADFTEVAWSTYHFLDILVWPDRMEVRAIDQSGALFDSVTLRP